MKLFSIIFIALVAVASALPVSDNLELSDLLTDDSNDISDLQASVLDAQQASEHQASKAMASIFLHQNEHPMSQVMSKVLLQQNEQKLSKAMAATNDLSLSVGNGYTRANADISQYSFSSCHAGDKPGSGHCRPQIDSPQVSFCFTFGLCVEWQCMWCLLPSRAGRLSPRAVAGCPLISRLRRAWPVCFCRAVAAAAAAVRFEAQ